MGKNLRKAENYNIGLDIGTGSVGWAVTDENGELYYFKKKPTWGSRLFPNADPASIARGPRGQRRRYDRRRQRLDLLQGFFAEEMGLVDPEFFIRLRQARLLPEDREEGHRDYRWPLFNGKDFTEQDYYKKYPTIYHLRKWLMETGEKADIRLIYLAFHNIVKTRGNFLHQDNPGLSAKNANMGESVKRLCDAVEVWCEERDLKHDCKWAEMQFVLEDVSLGRKEKQEKLYPLLGFGADRKKTAQAIAGAVLGYQVDFGLIFAIEGDAVKFKLDNDEKVEEFYSTCPDDGVELYEAIQAVYSSYILSGILKGGNGQTISCCKVAEYDRYGEDLSQLKALVREYAPSLYDEFFRGPHYEDSRWKKDYDPAKVKGYTLYNLGTSKLSYENFAKEVEKLFKGTGAQSDDRYVAMMDSFKEGVFLRRLKTSDNGSIPYQLHLEEMRAIIENQGKHYPFLLEQREKIESLVTFRIPYYVGPLMTKNARRTHDKSDGEMRFAWSERKEGQEKTRVYPWNWEDVIDKDKSAENFIRRMTGTCTYLQGEPVLPRCSLLYEKFCVLNELNGARWTQDGDKKPRFDADDRIGIFEDLFKRGSVTYKKVEDWLEQHGRSHPHVSGGQGETKFESRLSSHLFFCKTLGVDDIDGELACMVEELILWNTLFEDRDILRDKIVKKYGDRLTDEQIKKICKKRFSGWGRLSKKLLCELKADTSVGSKSIMDILVEGNPEGKHVGSAMILMEILHDKHFAFDRLIDEENLKRADSEGGLSIDDLPGSPALRRSVNQALRIVEEIVGIAGKPPANIFIEVTRDDDEKKKGKRTARRYDGLKEALQALKDEGAAVLSELKGLKPDQLDTRLSLYFMQNGKSLYSGKPLDIRRVINGDEAYQVDHIIPRSYIKDDSFENLALVLSEENQRKTDNLLLGDSIRKNMGSYWRSLHDAKLIGDKKFNNLMRDYITERQMQGFINRQLVETSQIVKFVRLMLEEKYPETEVESIKASLSHQLREAQGFVKCREANNYHHAHDALLAAEIGRFIQFRHGKLFDNPIAATHAMRDFVRSQSEAYKKTHRMPGSVSFIVGSFLTSGFDAETGEVFKDTWNAAAECEKIRRYLNFKQCYISRMPEVTSGAFWDATIYSPKGGGKGLCLPLKKELDPKKYGSYSSEQFACFFVYKYMKKDRTLFGFAPLPVHIVERSGDDVSVLEDYAEEVVRNSGGTLIEIVRPRVYKYQLVEIGGSRLFVSGAKKARNAAELAFDQGDMQVMVKMSAGESVDQSKIMRLFDSMEEQVKRFSPIQWSKLNLEQYRSRFAEANDEVQARILLGVADMFGGQAMTVDLTALGGVKSAGMIQPTWAKEMNCASNAFAFIDQSVTGMFERRQRLEL